MADYKYDNPEDAYKEAQRRIKKAKDESATELDLSGLGLTAVPTEIGRLTALSDLYLWGNQLTAVPLEITQLPKLVRLRLEDNPHLPIPPEIVAQEHKPWVILGYLLALCRIKEAKDEAATELDLTRLYLAEVPPEVWQLTALSELRLNSNKLTVVPPEIGLLTRLTHLSFTNNQLLTVPPEVWQLIELRVLALGRNQLTSVPPEIEQLTKLKKLYLWGNQLTGVPPEITHLTKLEKLDLRGNPESPIPPEIVAQHDNAPAILAYLREQQKTPSRPLNEAKLILVGQGGVGKTSLVKRLLGQGFDETENQTEGINIESWSLDVNRPRQGVVPIALNIWDFGGQEIMHATHQFFLTKRSLYLLVLDARQGEDEGRVEYWLALINSFAPDAPVLIVINKSDQHQLDINRRGLQEKYPAIKGFIRTSARSGQGIDQLETEIAALLATMEHVDTAFPASWMRVKNDLVTMRAQRHYLPYDEYEHLCRQHGIAEESSQTTLVRFLHDLGIVLNFTDDDRVRDTSVLNPNWVTEGIYALLNSQKLQKQQGLLARPQLRGLLPRDSYPNQQRIFLLDMMLKFELAFDLPDRQTLLIPDLIGKEQPAFEWDDANALQFAYQYSVLPRSILHRFMVRQHQRVDSEIRWRTGVMLHHDGSFGSAQDKFTALVKADLKAATIRISITGDGDRRQFLYSLRLEFAGIHDTIQGTKPREVVPIPGHPDAQPIDYAYLEQLEKMKMATVPHHAQNGEVIILDVQELLNGISTTEMRQAGLPTRREVLSGLKTAFNEDDFHDLLFDLNIRPGTLAGDTLDGKMLALVTHVERHGRFQDLVTEIAGKRPYLFDESRRPMSNS
ncbi:MAG: hypothetical protein CL608_14715 [Anaerolineaceae bacterium]|nr:hypothetical protein [Anaerolineaceae bacterium]